MKEVFVIFNIHFSDIFHFFKIFFKPFFFFSQTMFECTPYDDNWGLETCPKYGIREENLRVIKQHSKDGDVP